MVPTEDNYSEWVVSGIREYFTRRGYKVFTYSVGQVKERDFPVDRVFAVANKLLGLQFKRPLADTPPWKHDVLPHQHSDILQSDWIFYCLPRFSDPLMQEVALYHCGFIRGSQAPKQDLQGARYINWGALADGLLGCWHGVEISESIDLSTLVADILDNPRDSYLSLNRQAREAHLLSGGKAAEE